MKLIIQIPCYNEEKTLPVTLAELPRTLPGVDAIVHDRGRREQRPDSEVAADLGVQHIVRHRRNRGLAAAFQAGSRPRCCGRRHYRQYHADNQYYGPDIAVLVEPIVAARADIVIGDRGVSSLEHFSASKRLLQRLGSWVVERAAGIPIPDATSGFRAFSREAALRLTVLSEYTYTLETLIQAGVRGMTVCFVPIRTNPERAKSRLVRNVPSFIWLSAATILRFYTMYRPLRVFVSVGSLLVVVATLLGLRFLYFYAIGHGAGNIQSLILAAILSIVGFQVCLIGLLADATSMNRKMTEETFTWPG